MELFRNTPTRLVRTLANNCETLTPSFSLLYTFRLCNLVHIARNSVVKVPSNQRLGQSERVRWKSNRGQKDIFDNWLLQHVYQRFVVCYHGLCGKIREVANSNFNSPQQQPAVPRWKQRPASSNEYYGYCHAHYDDSCVHHHLNTQWQRLCGNFWQLTI